jgi:hypothetical protein
MCDRECLCKSCMNGGCSACDYATSKLLECRLGGVERCRHYKKYPWWRRLFGWIQIMLSANWHLRKAR